MQAFKITLGSNFSTPYRPLWMGISVKLYRFWRSDLTQGFHNKQRQIVIINLNFSLLLFYTLLPSNLPRCTFLTASKIIKYISKRPISFNVNNNVFCGRFSFSTGLMNAIIFSVQLCGTFFFVGKRFSVFNSKRHYQWNERQWNREFLLLFEQRYWRKIAVYVPCAVLEIKQIWTML